MGVNKVLIDPQNDRLMQDHLRLQKRTKIPDTKILLLTKVMEEEVVYSKQKRTCLHNMQRETLIDRNHPL